LLVKQVGSSVNNSQSRFRASYKLSFHGRPFIVPIGTRIGRHVLGYR